MNITSSKGLCWILISFIVGVAVESLYKIPQVIVVVFSIAGFLISFTPFFLKELLKRKKLLIVLGFSILFFCLAVLRYQVIQSQIENDPILKFNDSKEKIELTGRIIAEPDVRNNYQNLKIKAKGTNSIVLALVDRHKKYSYLDEVKITGNLETPTSKGDFNYKNYLMKDGVYSVMAFPEIELVSKDHKYNAFSFLYDKILFFKSKMKESIGSNYSPPGSFIIEGIILGNDKNMNQELKDKFNSAGLSHVTAVSGSNIVIMTSIIMSILLFIGLWRQQALYFTFVFVWTYVVLVGLPASAVRAAIMASLFLLSRMLGKQNTSSRTVIIAAAVMVFQNPFVLFYDIGFQLSFLASMALIYLKPIIDYAPYYFIKKRKDLIKLIVKFKIKNLLDILSTTLAAQIFTLPIIIYNFKSISLVSLIANLLILPLITILTFLGFWSVVLGIFSRFLGWVFYLPCQFLLMYFLKVLDAFYQPWARLNINISLLFCFTYYIFLVFFIWLVNKKSKPEFLDY